MPVSWTPSWYAACLLQCSREMGKEGVTVTDEGQDKENKLVELSCMVLCNLTRRVEGGRALIQVGTELEGLYVHKVSEHVDKRTPKGESVNESVCA